MRLSGKNTAIPRVFPKMIYSHGCDGGCRNIQIGWAGPGREADHARGSSLSTKARRNSVEYRRGSVRIFAAAVRMFAEFCGWLD